MADTKKNSPDFNAPRIDSSVQQDASSTTKGAKDTPKNEKKRSDLAIRLASGSFYAIFIIAGCMLTNIGTMIMAMIAGGVCAAEFFAMLRSDAKLPNETLGVIGAVAFPPAIYFFGLNGAVAVVLALMMSLLV